MFLINDAVTCRVVMETVIVNFMIAMYRTEYLRISKVFSNQLSEDSMLVRCMQ